MDWHADNNAQIEDAPAAMRDVLGKLPAQVGKIACVLHACHDPGAEQTEFPIERMQGAIDVVEYHRAHAQRAYALLGVEVTPRADPRERRVTRILRKTEAQDAEAWVARTAILDGLRTVTAEELTETLASMERAGTVERRTVGGVTKPTEQWRLAELAHPFGDSDFSDYSPIDTEYSEYPEAPNGHDPAVLAQTERLAGLTPDELAAYRQELSAAPADDPDLPVDLEALALFDAMHAAGAIA